MEYIKKYGIIVGFIVLSLGYFLFQNDEEPPEFTVPKQQEIVTEDTYIYVDIKGAVKYPGVYKLDDDSRVFHVVQKAGGFLQEADDLAINLSETLRDEMVIYVPLLSEEYPLITDVIENEDNGIININTATQLELESLPGVGPSTAKSIIAYREEHGEFVTVDDLLNVSGIGEQTLADLKPYIVV